MSAEPAWHPDPYGRYAMRYHDGREWTEHVIDGDGRQLVDPMGRSSVIPFVMPRTATGSGTAPGAASRSPWPPPDPTTRKS